MNRILMHVASASALAFVASTATGQFPVWSQEYPTRWPGLNARLTYDARLRRVLAVDTDHTVTPTRVRLWAWDGVEWSVVSTQNAPTETPGFIAHDAVRNVLVMIRVTSGSSDLETWELSGTTWARNTSGGAPDRYSATPAFFYCPARGSMILVLPSTSSTAPVTVWEYRVGLWQRLSIGVSPVAEHTLVATLDTLRNRIVLFGAGASRTETWEIDATTLAAWVWRQPTTSPPARGTFAYDEARGRAVLGGSTQNPFTWEWDGTQWLLNLAPPPTGSGGSMAYDTHRGRMVLLATNNTTWEYYTAMQATFGQFGSGCAGSGGTPTLAAAPGSLPWLGETLVCQLGSLPNAPVAVPFGVLGVSRENWLGIPLPFNLGLIGAPGCTLLVSGEQTTQLANTGGTAEWRVPLPRAVTLLGARFYQQALVLDPAANAFGAIMSNAAEARIGDR